MIVDHAGLLVGEHFIRPLDLLEDRLVPPLHQIKSLQSVHTKRPHSGGMAATFAGGWFDQLRGNAFWIFPAQLDHAGLLVGEHFVLARIPDSVKTSQGPEKCDLISLESTSHARCNCWKPPCPPPVPDQTSFVNNIDRYIL